MLCGYDFTGLTSESVWPVRCPECGGAVRLSMGRFASERSVPQEERRSLRIGGRLAQAGILLIAVVPILGAMIDAAAWWFLLRGSSGRATFVGRALAISTTLLTIVSLLLVSAAWVIVAGVYVFGVEFAGLLADDVAAGALISAAAIAWSVRHGLGGLAMLRRGVHKAAGTSGSLAISAIGAPVLAVTGVGLIGLGVIVMHIALFPPVCLLLPLWLGGAVVWLVLTLAAFQALASIPAAAAPPESSGRLRA